MYNTLLHWKGDYTYLTEQLDKYSQQQKTCKLQLNKSIKNGSSEPLYKIINRIRMLKMLIEEIQYYIKHNKPPFGSYCIVCTRLYDIATKDDQRKYELIGFCEDECYNIFCNSIK